MKTKVVLFGLAGLFIINFIALEASNAELSENEYLFFKAIAHNNIPKMKELISAGVNVNVVSPKSLAFDVKSSFTNYLHKKQTPLIFVFNVGSIPIEAVTMLLDAGSDVNAQDENGRTPLHNMANWLTWVVNFIDEKEIMGIAERLLELGANPEIVDKFGQSPIDLFQELYNGSYKISMSAWDNPSFHKKKANSLQNIISLMKRHNEIRQNYLSTITGAGDALARCNFPPEIVAIVQSYMSPGEWERNIKQKTPLGGPEIDLSIDSEVEV